MNLLSTQDGADGGGGAARFAPWARYALPMVLLLAFTVRLVFLQKLAVSPFLQPIEGGNDRALYHALARYMAAGHWMPSSVFEYMPLYPWALGLLYALAGPSLYLAGLVGIFLDTATCFLIVKLASRYGAARWAAAAAGLAYALYPVAVAYAPMTMANTLNALLVTGFLSLAEGTTPTSSWRRWLGLGLLTGAGMLSFAGLLPMAVVWAVWVGWRYRTAWRGWAPRMAACGLAAALPLLPVLAHNLRAEGHFVFITAHGGFNLYMGNHEGATGYPVQIDRFRGTSGSLLQDARAEAEAKAGRRLDASEFSAYWSARARAFWRDRPAEAWRLLGMKFLKFWNCAEYDDMRLLPMMRLTRTAFTAPGWVGFGAISVLALAGLFLVRARGLLKMILLAGMAGLVLFFITSRYRLTLVPLMAVLGALTLTRLATEGAAWLRARRGAAGVRTAGAFAVRAVPTLALSAAVVFWPLKHADFRALDHYNTAAYLLAYGDASSALDQADQGLRLTPHDPSLLFARGNALFGLNRLPDAAAAYRTVLTVNPAQAQAHFNLGVCLFMMDARAAAFAEVKRAIELDPLDRQFRAWLDAHADP